MKMPRQQRTWTTTNCRIACLLFWIAGCSSSTLDPAHPSPVLDRGPHQGALRPIEGANGFIEVAIEPVRDAPSGSPKFRVAIYFLDRDQTASFRPMPTEVVMTAAWPDAPTSETTDLTINPVPGDPTGAAKFVAPAANHQGEPSGTVRAKLGDRAISAAL